MKSRALVTAGAAGIGYEIAKAFVGAGAEVFICDIDAAALGEARERLPGLRTCLCDVGDRTAVETMVAEAGETMGGIDVLVNNAGISGPTRAVKDVDPEDWDAVIRINLTSTFHVTKNAIPFLLRSPNASIINMSSAAGRFGYPNRSPYATTKWGLIGFTKTLSMELGADNIRVNAIAPGAVAGDRIQRVFEERAAATGRSLQEVEEVAMANQSLKYLVDPKDIASLALFLASEAARSISGQVIPIDGDYQRN